MVGAVGVGGQVAAAVRGDHLEPGKLVERALEDQVRQRDRGVERIADGVAEPAVAGEPLGELRRALRMDEQRHAQLLGLGPDRMELGIGEFLAGDRCRRSRRPSAPASSPRSRAPARRGRAPAGVSEAKAAKRSGLAAQSSASFSFCSLTIWPASSRSRRYQKGLIDSTSMSMACASIAFSRLSISMKASAAPLTGGSCTVAAVGAQQRDRPRGSGNAHARRWS